MSESVESIISTLQGDSQERFSLSAQQELFLQQKYQALAMVERAGDSLDRKAGDLMRASTLIITLAGAFGALEVFTQGLAWWQVAVIGLAFVSFLLVAGLSLVAWSPKRFGLPGALEEQVISARYLQVDGWSCYLQILSDCLGTIEQIRKVNQNKADYINVSLGILLFQVLGLGILILVK